MEYSNDENNNIRRAIMSVIVFFDMFDYPLTSFEIWKFLPMKCELAEVIKIFDKINNVNPPTLFAKGGYEKEMLIPQPSLRKGATKNGLYFLAGREDIVDLRMKRYNIADRKFKRAILIGRIFKIVPWIKMIAVGNIMGSNNLKDDSDIDLFIISQKNRIWLTRFFCVLITKILGIRPTAVDARDKICLSFFVDEEAMDLNRLMLYATAAKSPRGDFAGADDFAGVEDKVNPPTPFAKGGNYDIYFIYWLANLTPIYNIDNYYEKLIAANLWLIEYLPNWEPIIAADRRSAGKKWSKYYYNLIEALFGGWETFYKRIQMKILPAEIKNKMNSGSDVIVNDHRLKLHTNDRRECYRKSFIEKMNQLMIKL
jgi:hypothetical protein